MQVRLIAELLEHRALLAGGQWIAVFDGLAPASHVEEQARYGQNLLQVSGLQEQDVRVVAALDLSGSFLVQTSPDITEEALTTQLQTVPGFVFAQEYQETGDPTADGPAAKSSGVIDVDVYKQFSSEFDYDAFVSAETYGEPVDQSGSVDAEQFDALTNNNLGNLGTSRFTQSETTLVAFGNTVVVGYNDSGSFSGANKFTGFSRSTDGGATFTDGGTLPTNPFGDAGDPVLARNDTTGRLYFSTLQFTGSGIQMFRSDDNGQTWLAPVQAAPGKSGFQDKQWHTVDNFAGPGNGNVYMVARDFGSGNGIYFFRSTDHGNSFGPAGGTFITSGWQGAYVAVAPDHSVYVFWWNGSTLQMRKSTNQGLSFGPPVTVASGLVGGTNGSLFIVGQNNGESFNRSIRNNSFPHAAVNPTNGHIYVTYNNDGPGADKADVFMVMSTNGGASWSPPIKINDDLTTTDQWQPTIAVTPDGSKLGIFYYSRQEDTTTLDGDPVNNQFKYYGRIGSISGSTVTFAPSFAVSDAPSKPEVGRDSVVNSTYMGDYDHAVATPGAFHVTWSDSRSPLPGGGTRQDPNVFYEKISLGMAVTSTIPAANSIVSTPPTSFTVEVGEPVDPSSLQASDFTVNGSPADSVSYTPGSTTIVFNYASTPVTTQGLQSMHIDAGAFTRASDGGPVAEFHATFRYDATLLQVASTAAPFPNGTFTLPGPFTYEVTFNEPVNPATVQTSDLALSGIAGAFVSGVTVLPGATTARFTIGGVTTEGALTASIAAGAVLDAFGNPGAAFSSTYQVDIGSVPYPVPLDSTDPRGSLIYDPTISGVINSSTDSDNFTLNIDSGQTITVVVTPDSAGLRPSVELRDSSFALLGSAVAPAAGQNALLQTIATISGGVYNISVGGAGTSGAYTVKVTLNAAQEEEGIVSGAANDSLAAAQNINGSFVTLETSQASAQRGAVVGELGTASAIINGSFETGNFSGWTATTTNNPFRPWAVSGAGAGGGFGMLTTQPQDGARLAWNGFDGGGPMEFRLHQDVILPGGDPVLTWTDRLQWNFTLGGFASLPRTYHVEVLDPANNALLATLYSFSTGTQFTNPTGNTGWVTHTASLGAFAGSTVRLQFREVIPQSATGPGQFELDAVSIASTPDDWYSYTLGAGESTTLALKTLTGGDLNVELYDSSGTLLQTGAAGPTNFDRAINFTAVAAGVYYARVSNSGAENATYSLVSTRNAAFDTEGNDSFSGAQDISGVDGVLGNLNAGGASTLYATGNDGSTLVTIDPATGAATTVGPLGFTQTYAAAFTPDGALWTIVNGFSTAARLATIDLATGAATPVGSSNWTGSPIIALEADASGNLYAGNYNGTFFSVNKTTGQMSPIGSLFFNLLMDFTFDQSGTLWAVDGSNRLFRVNTTTGAGTFQTTISGVGGTVMGMMVDPADNTLYVTTYSSSSRLYRLDPATGVATQVGAGLGVSYPHGGDFSPGGGPTTVAINWLDSGWWNSSGFHSATNKNYFAGLASPTNELRNFFVFDLASVSQPITGATLRLFNPFSGYFSPDPTETYTVFDVSTPIPDLRASASGQTAIFDDLGAGTSLGSETVSVADNNTIIEIALNAAGAAALDAARGGLAAVGGALTTLSGTSTQRLFAFSGASFHTRQLVLNLGQPDDWYSFDVTNTSQTFRLETSTPADGPGEFVNELNPRIELYDPSNNLVASGVVTADGRNEFIVYSPATTGKYRVRVSSEGNTEGEYFLSKNFVAVGSPPVLSNLTLTPSIDENGVATLSGDISDPDAEDSFTVTVAWGEGPPQTYSYPAGTTSFTVTHQYLDDNPSGTASDVYPVHVRLTDSNGLSDTGNASITVHNVAPSDLVINSGVIDENGVFTLNGSFTDPGTQDTHTVVINWGAGQGTTTLDLAAGVTSFSAGRQYLDDGPSPGNGTSFDIYAVSVSVTDDDQGAAPAATADASVTVNNVAPALNPLVLSSTIIDENDSVTLNGAFIDPGTLDAHEVVIDWGDGSANTVINLALGGRTFSAAHQYLDDNPPGTPSDSYTITATVRDDDAGSDSRTASVTVNNVAPTLGGGVSLGLLANNGTDKAVVFDPATNTVLGSVSVGPGTVGDALIVPNGSLGFVTDFASRLWAIDLTASPPVLANGGNPIPIANPGEDIAITPDNQFLVISDGSVTAPLSVVSVGSLSQVGTFSLGHDANTVDVAEDGSILVGSFNADRIRRLSINSSGTITDTGETLTLFNPMNVYAGPGAETGVAVTIGGQIQTFRMAGLVPIESRFLSGSVVSAAFSPAGDRLYVRRAAGQVLAFGYDPATGDLSDSPLFTVSVATAPNFFGMDQLAVSGDGTRLYVPTQTSLNVYDASNGGFITSITDPAISEATGVSVVDADRPGLALSADTIDENGSVTLKGAFVDPGELDLHTVTIDWGDGNSETLTLPVGDRSFSADHQYLDDNPSGTPSDQYTITVTIADDDAGSVSATANVTVNNVAPTIGGGPSIGLLANNGTDRAVVFDPATNAVLGSVSVGPGNVGDAFVIPDGSLGFVTDLSFRLWAIDLTSPTPTLANGGQPIQIANVGADISITPDHEFLVISDGSANQPLSIVSIAALAQVNTFHLGHDANSVDVAADGSILVTSFNTDRVRRLTIDGGGAVTDTGEVLPAIDPNNVVAAPGGASGVVITRGAAQVRSFTTGGLTPVDVRSPSGTFGISAAFSPSGDRLYVRSNASGGGFVDAFAYDPSTGAIGAAPLFTISVANTPTFFGMDQVAVSPDGARLYVSHPTSLNVYDATSGGFLASITDPAIQTALGVAVVGSAGGGVTLSADAIDENGSVTVEGSFTDPGLLDVHTVTIDWGDGNTETFTLPVGERSFSFSHRYLDDDPTTTSSDQYTISVTLADDDTGSDSATASVTVNNVAPDVDPLVLSSQVIDENDELTVTGTFSDPGSLDVHTVTIDWGDGNSETFTLPVGDRSFSKTHRYLDDNPSGTPSDQYTITATVADDDGGLGLAGVSSETTEFITNGGFETGDFTGWTVINSGSPSAVWAINDGSFDPTGPGAPLPPISGAFDAVSSQGGPSTHILSEAIVVPGDITSATLSWSDRIRNHANQFSDPNQEFRVRILDEVGQTIHEVFSTNPGDPLQQIGPNQRSFDLTSVLQSLAGQTIQVSFQQEDNLFYFNVTLDDVSLQVTTEIDGAPAVVTVNNVAPHDVVIDPVVQTYVFAVGAPQAFEGSFADVGTLDTHTAVWTFSHVVGETTVVETRPATLTQAAGSGTVSDVFVFDDDSVNQDGPGVYTVTLTVTDDDTGQTASESRTFVVYDPSAGFVTGGGWIDTPAGAYVPDPSLAGTATFGFLSKYQKGATAPTGQTEFQFKVADLNFHSASYEWLVVAGARAQYKGTGTINGAGNYGFLLTVIDSQLNGGGGVDKFRMKIWDKDVGDALVYDSGLGASDDDTPPTPLDGGSIIIHTEGQALHVAGSAAAGVESLLTPDALQPAFAQAIETWAAAGADADQLAALAAVDVQLANLSGELLGMASPANIIWIDVDAAGYGWSAGSAGGVDLVSVLAHELGHILGLDDLPNQHDVMGSHLAPGAERLPSSASLQPLPGGTAWGDPVPMLLSRDALFTQGFSLDSLRPADHEEDRPQNFGAQLSGGDDLATAIAAILNRRLAKLRAGVGFSTAEEDSDRGQDASAVDAAYAELANGDGAAE